MTTLDRLARRAGVLDLGEDLQTAQLCLLTAQIESHCGITFPEALLEQCSSAAELWDFAEIIASHSPRAITH